MRGAAFARSQSRVKRFGNGLVRSFRLRSQNAASTDLPTEGESNGIPASPSSARRARPASVDEDEDVE